MIPLKKAHQEFIEDLKKKDRAEATILAYGKDIEQLINFAAKRGRKVVSEIKLSDLRDFMEKLDKEGYTKKSISRKTNSTKTFFKFLKEKGYVTEDPALDLAHPKFEVKPPRILSRVEYRALRDTCRHDTRTYGVVEMLLQTGIRIGELALVTLDEIKFGDGKQGKLFIPARGKHIERTIPLNLAVQRAIKSYLKVRPKSKEKTLFITKTGRPLLVRNIRATLDRYFRLAGISDVKVNDLRHTFVAEHLKRGASLLLVSKIAGHKRLSTTEKYLEHIEKPKEEKMEIEEL